MFRSEDQVTQQYAEEGRQLATTHEFPIWVTMGQILSGWALVSQGMTEQGLLQIQEGLATWRAIGAQISVPYFLFLLADAYRQSGQVKKGLFVLTEALTLTNNTEERWWEAELYRLKGELLLTQESTKNLKLAIPSPPQVLKLHAQPPQSGEAEEYFRHAVSIARRQQAKSLELRAAISLARLKHQQGKSGEALPLLEEPYSWFTEGFDTADLQEAKALLDSLREQPATQHLSALRTTRAKRKASSMEQHSPEPRVAQSVQG
jgi:predicted ATPase